MKKQIGLFLIFLLAFGLRIYGLNWDQGFHLHPDERFLTMVGTGIRWPKNIGEYLDTKTSPLNPYNNGYDFFVYGSFPLFLTKAIAERLGLGHYSDFNLVGRAVSAIFDSGVVILLYQISGQIWPSLIYSLMVLPIQLSHFFAVDTFLNFFLVLGFYLALKKKVVLAAISLGLALASKISALLFFPLVIVIIGSNNKREFKRFFLESISLLLVSFFSFRLFSPYNFKGFIGFNPQFISNLKTLKSFDNPETWFPPAVQWIKTKPIIFPAINLFFWGLGPILGVVVLFSLVSFVRELVRERKPNYLVLSLIWVAFLFIFQGVQFVKTMRYFLPIYPHLALLAGSFLSSRLKNGWQKLAVALLLVIYPLMFINIYSHPHTRVQASEWIFKNVSPGKILSCEHWDDCLPLPLSGYQSIRYQTEMLSLYDPDTKEKWLKISQQLEKIDYLILSSNRLWGSIPEVSERYPIAARYYQLLFSDRLGFEKVAEFTSYPKLQILNFKWQIVDDWAEEAFTVYDHPKVMIFKNIQKFSQKELLEQLFST